MPKGRGGMFRQPKRSARGRGAAGAGGVNPEMLRQAQELQSKIALAQEEFKEATVEASAGGGVVTVVLGGDHKLRRVSIDAAVLDPDDPEMLQDLIMAAVNEATDTLAALQSEQMSGITGGLPLPGP